MSIDTTRLLKVAEAISELPSGAAFHEAEFDVAEVTKILTRYKVTAQEFMLLDNTPNRLGYNLGNGRDWHWKLRRWRNTLCREHTFQREFRCKTCGTIKARDVNGFLYCPTSHEGMTS